MSNSLFNIFEVLVVIIIVAFYAFFISRFTIFILYIFLHCLITLIIIIDQLYCPLFTRQLTSPCQPTSISLILLLYSYLAKFPFQFSLSGCSQLVARVSLAVLT